MVNWAKKAPAIGIITGTNSVYLVVGANLNYRKEMVGNISNLYKKMFSTIYYIYDSFVYKGTMGKIHGSGFSKEHALGAFSFILLLNFITLTNFLRQFDIITLNKLTMFSVGFIIYFLNRYLLMDKEYKMKPSGIMIISALLYAVLSVAIMCLSFIGIVPKYKL